MAFSMEGRFPFASKRFMAYSLNINSDYKTLIESSNGNNIPGRVVQSSCKDEPNYIYATIGAGFLNNMGFNLSYGELMIKSSNSGNSWNQVSIPTEDANEWASLAWHALALSVHPENPNIIFAIAARLACEFRHQIS